MQERKFLNQRRSQATFAYKRNTCVQSPLWRLCRLSLVPGKRMVRVIHHGIVRKQQLALAAALDPFGPL